MKTTCRFKVDDCVVVKGNGPYTHNSARDVAGRSGVIVRLELEGEQFIYYIKFPTWLDGHGAERHAAGIRDGHARRERLT